jgi:hypothetical protein
MLTAISGTGMPVRRTIFKEPDSAMRRRLGLNVCSEWHERRCCVTSEELSARLTTHQST